MDEAARCDRIALLQAGRLLSAPGTPEAVAASFGAPLVSVRATGDRAALLDRLRAAPGVARADVFGDVVHVTGEGEPSASAALAERLRQSLGVEAAPTAPTVEDVFMARMGDPDTLSSHVQPTDA